MTRKILQLFAVMLTLFTANVVAQEPVSPSAHAVYDSLPPFFAQRGYNVMVWDTTSVPGDTLISMWFSDGIAWHQYSTDSASYVFVSEPGSFTIGPQDTIFVKEGSGITITQDGDSLVIGSTAGGGTLTTLKESDSQVGDADIVTLDFGVAFDLAESPDTEINVSLDLSETANILWHDGANITITHTWQVAGITDPVWSYTDGIANLSAGTLQQGGTAVALTASNVGGGLSNFNQKNVQDLEFNTFSDTDFDLSSNLYTLDASITRDTELLDVEEDNSTIVSNVPSIDFGTAFDVTNDGGEADISLDLTETADLTFHDGANIEVDHLIEVASFPDPMWTYKADTVKLNVGMNIDGDVLANKLAVEALERIELEGLAGDTEIGYDPGATRIFFNVNGVQEFDIGNSIIRVNNVPLQLWSTAAPSVTTAGAVAFDDNFYATSEGAFYIHDGTENGILAHYRSNDAPSNNDLLQFSTSTNDWETVQPSTLIIDHGGLTGLADDDHSQYALLAGRSGGQTLIGGTAASNDLVLQSTSDVTRGSIRMIDKIFFDDNELIIRAEGATDDGFELDINITDPTADRSIAFPDASGTIAVSAIAPITLSAAGAIGLNQNAGTDVTADLEEETHVSEHQDGGADELSVTGLSGLLADAQKVSISKNSGAIIGTRPEVNLIEGSNITLTILDDAGGNEVDVTIDASATGEANTASNLGGGLANFDSKSGVDLRFNSFASTDFDLALNLLTIDPERIEDIAGAMVSGNTETGITVTYEDVDGTIDYELDGEWIQDNVIGTMVTGNTETLIMVTYDDAGDELDFVVESNLSNYTNDVPFLTDITEGNYIDVTGSGVSRTIAMDPTEVGSVTWGTADATWTFDATSGINPELGWTDSFLILDDIGVRSTGLRLLDTSTGGEQVDIYFDGSKNRVRVEGTPASGGNFELWVINEGTEVGELDLVNMDFDNTGTDETTTTSHDIVEAQSLTLTTDLTIPNGGTGASTFTDGGVLFGNGTGAIQASAVMTNGQLLIGDGTTEPTLATLTEGSGINITNGAGSITIAATGGSGTMTTVEESGTPLGDPDIVTLDFLSGFDLTESPDTEINISLDYSEDPVNLAATDVTGTLPVSRGGTGVTSLTDGGVLFGNSGSDIQASAVMTNGQLLIGDGTTEPTLATLTDLTTSGIDVSNGAGSITLSVNTGELDNIEFHDGANITITHTVNVASFPDPQWSYTENEVGLNVNMDVDGNILANKLAVSSGERVELEGVSGDTELGYDSGATRMFFNVNGVQQFDLSGSLARINNIPLKVWNSTAPSVTEDGAIAFDTNYYGTNEGAFFVDDGTENGILVHFSSSDAPGNGDVLVFNTTSDDWENTATTGTGSIVRETEAIVIAASEEISLTSTSGEAWIFTATRALTLSGIRIVYTSAASEDIGDITFEIGRYTSGGTFDDDYFDTHTISGSKSKGVSDNVTSFLNSAMGAGDTAIITLSGTAWLSGTAIVTLELY